MNNRLRLKLRLKPSSNLRLTLALLGLVCLAAGLLVACTRQTDPKATRSPLLSIIPTMTLHNEPISPTQGTAENRTFLPLVSAPSLPTSTLRLEVTPTLPTPTRTPRVYPTSIIPTTTIPVNLGGLHVEAVGDHTGYEEFLRACAAANRPVALIKVFGDGYSAKLAKDIDPRTVTIWRKPAKTGTRDYSDNPPGNWEWPRDQTADIARRWVKSMYPEWDREHDHIDYFEIVNEPNPATITQTLIQADFMMAAMQEAESHDPPYHLAIWSFSSGTPEPWQAELISPTLRYAAEHGHVLAVHDGSVNPERPLFRQGYKDGTALRYRMFKPLLGPYMPRVAITEAYQLDGYYHPDWFDWQWYLTELAKDNVIGAAWFTLGVYSFNGIDTVNVVDQLPAFAQTLGCR